MNEIWKDIKGYEGYYQVSNLGNVKSLNRKVNVYENDCIKKRPLQEKLIAKTKDKKGYIRVSLSKGYNHKCPLLHRLVAETFIPNPNDKPQVNHIDGNKSNNCVDNLEWVTNKENTQHAVKNGLISHDKLVMSSLIASNKNKKPIIQYKNGIEIARYESVKEAGLKNGIFACSISANAKGKLKRAGGYTWKYAN